MYLTIQTLPQFAHLTDREIYAALEEKNPDNPISMELYRLIHGGLREVVSYFRKHKKFPDDISGHYNYPIEQIALDTIAKTARRGIAESIAEAKKLVPV